MNESGESTLSPEIGIILIGVSCAIGSFSSTFIIRLFRRKTILITGHVFMCIALFLCGLFKKLGKDSLGIVCTFLFMFIYCISSGAVAWMHATETTTDIGLGLFILTIWGVTFVESLVMPPLMDEAYLGLANTFFLFSGLSLLGGFYC